MFGHFLGHLVNGSVRTSARSHFGEDVIMKLLTTSVVAAAAFAVFSGFAEAATLFKEDGAVCSVTFDVEPDADECFGLSTGNAQNVDANADQFEYSDLTTVTGLFGITNWTEFQSEPDFEDILDDAKTGFFDIIANSYATVAVLLKSGNEFAAYKFDDGFSGQLDFATANDKGLSNYVVLGTGTAVVPLPAAGWLLLGGIGGMAALKRRKKKASS